MPLNRYRIQSTLWFLILSAICLSNKFGIINFSDSLLKRLIKSYFNDIFGCVCFLLLISIALTICAKRPIRINLLHVEILTFTSGIYWEYITPLYRPKTISDPLDIVAYMLGGILFWFFFGGRKNPLIK